MDCPIYVDLFCGGFTIYGPVYVTSVRVDSGVPLPLLIAHDLFPGSPRLVTPFTLASFDLVYDCPDLHLFPLLIWCPDVVGYPLPRYVERFTFDLFTVGCYVGHYSLRYRLRRHLVGSHLPVCYLHTHSYLR